jgi:hypothetical protein
MIVNNSKIEINLLALAGVGSLIVSMFIPWWGFFTNNNTESFLYPYIIKGPVTMMVGYVRSPQMVLLTAGMAVSIILGLVGSFIHKTPGKVCRFLSGLITVFFLWRFIIRLTEITESYNLPLQGVGDAEYSGFFVATATSSLKAGFYLAGVGAVLLILAVFIPWKIGIGRTVLPERTEG